MTEEQKAKELENNLAGLSQRYLIYRKMRDETLKSSDKIRYENTMARIAQQVKDVLFKIYLIDLEKRLCLDKNKQPIPSCPLPDVNDGGTAPAA